MTDALQIALDHHRAGRWSEAEAACRQMLVTQPDCAEIHNNLGAALHAQQRHDEAIDCFRRAVSLRPQYREALLNLGTALKQQGHRDEAVVHLRAAIRLHPDPAIMRRQLVALCDEFALVDEKVDTCQESLQAEPTNASLYNTLGVALHHQGRGVEAMAAYWQAVALRPDYPAAHSNILCAMNLLGDYDPAEIFAEHLAWGRRHAEPLTASALPHDNERSPDRRLRVGYVSAYFRHHAVNFFTEPILLSHDHRQFEIFCYSDVPSGDEVTQRIRDVADHWRHVVHLTDQQIAEQVRADKIDILVDLTGHIGGNRLLAFARKPAPVQVTYIGYQNTTGMSAMDYRLTDARADPPGLSDAYYTEKLVRLPRAFFCYKPADDAPPLTPLPAATLGQVTFGSFNNSPKVTRAVIDAWLTILGRVSDSRLLVLAYRGGYVERHFHQLAAERGIDPSRVELCDKRIRSQYLALQQRADIALDPFPFNGHTTTCDSLWMGVPVVMLEGTTYASRFGGSVLANVGLERLITRSVDEYIDTAVALAHDLETLTQWRDELRGRMVASALLDFAGFTRHLETAYRHMWHHWCHRENSR